MRLKKYIANSHSNTFQGTDSFTNYTYLHLL